MMDAPSTRIKRTLLAPFPEKPVAYQLYLEQMSYAEIFTPVFRCGTEELKCAVVAER